MKDNQLGHLLGAAGSVETILATLSIEKSLLLSNRGLENPIRRDMLLIQGNPLPADVNIVMKNSFGFGGINAVLVLRRI